MAVQDKFNKPNVIYKITKVINLGGGTLTIPAGCTLDFQGGIFYNGTIVGNNTEIRAGLQKIFETSTVLEGTWKINKFPISWYGATPSSEDNINEITLSINFGIKNGVEVFVPAGEYLIGSTLYVLDPEYRPDYPFPVLNELKIKGEPLSKIKATSTFQNESLVYMGNSVAPYKGQLYLDTITLDGNSKEISLVNAVQNWQARFYAVNSNFLGVTGPNSYAINSYNSSVWLKDCVLQGVGSHTTNGIGVVARYTTIEMIDCFVSYFSEGIRISSFSESTVIARGCLFQNNAANITFEGKNYLGNTCLFEGCYFVETKPGDVQFKCLDTSTFGSWGNMNFIGCQFDGYSANAEDPILNLDFTNVSGNFNFTGCNVWLATSPEGTVPLRNVKIGQYTTALFTNCTGFYIINNNNPPYARFTEVYSSGNSAGASVQGINVRNLNIVNENHISECKLENKTITLQKGVYRILGRATCYGGQGHKLYLYNKTDSIHALVGSSAYSISKQTVPVVQSVTQATGSDPVVNSTDQVMLSGQTESIISGRIVVGKLTEFQLYHYIMVADPQGLGVPVTVPKIEEQYTTIEIWKEA